MTEPTPQSRSLRKGHVRRVPPGWWISPKRGCFILNNWVSPRSKPFFLKSWVDILATFRANVGRNAFDRSHLPGMLPTSILATPPAKQNWREWLFSCGSGYLGLALPGQKAFLPPFARTWQECNLVRRGSSPSTSCIIASLPPAASSRCSVMFGLLVAKRHSCHLSRDGGRNAFLVTSNPSCSSGKTGQVRNHSSSNSSCFPANQDNTSNPSCLSHKSGRVRNYSQQARVVRLVLLHLIKTTSKTNLKRPSVVQLPLQRL